MKLELNMQREILFGGKSINSGEWVEGVTFANGTIKRKRNSVFILIGGDRWVGIHPESLTQYTGKKDKNGIKIFEGEFKASNYSDAVKELYQLNEIPSGFCVNEDYEANGYSVVDGNGIQHIYELSPKEFYNAFMNLE